MDLKPIVNYKYHKCKGKVMQRQRRKANVLWRENKKSSISRPCQSGSDEMEEAKRKREEAAPNSIKSHLKEPSQLFPPNSLVWHRGRLI